MTYAGWNPSYRAFQQSPYIATGGETTLTVKGSPESILFKNGKILTPSGVDYSINYSTGVITLVTAATSGDVYQLLNLSTYHVSDTYNRLLADTLFTPYTSIVVTNTTPYNITSQYSTFIEMDCGGGSAFVTLPQIPKKGLIYWFRDKLATISSINKFTIKRYGATGTIMGIAEDMDVTTPKCSFGVFWNGTDWRVF